MKDLAVTSLQIIFWCSVAGMFYTYLLYPVVLMILFLIQQIKSDLRYLTGRKDRRTPYPNHVEWPFVSMVVAAYNEERDLAEKLANLKELDYPRDRIEFIFVSDGSTDATNEMLQNAHVEGMRPIVLSERKGKPNALNQGVAASHGEVLLLTDAATLLAPDAVKKLVRHFINPTVGAVCGALGFKATGESKQTEGVYWRYESMLRLMEGRLGATLTASGALYALRASCYVPLQIDAMIEDFLIPMSARHQGFRVLYDPEATGVDVAAATVAGEFTRRVRLAMGSFRAIPQLFHNRLDAVTMLALISHKIMRWFFPFMGVASLVCNLLLLNYRLYQVTMVLHVLFCVWAAFGYLLRDREIPGIARLGYYLWAMHWAFMVGSYRLVTGKAEVRWQRVD